MTEKPEKPDIAAIAEDVQRRFPNIMAALHRSELSDDLQEKNRQLARLGAAMPRLVNR